MTAKPIALDTDALSDFLTRASEKHSGDGWVEAYAKDAVEEFGFNEADFTERLKAAAKAHHAYQTELGHPHDGWALWYAEHMTRQ